MLEGCSLLKNISDNLPSVYITQRMLGLLGKNLPLSYLIPKRYNINLRKGSWAYRCYGWDKDYRRYKAVNVKGLTVKRYSRLELPVRGIKDER